MFFSSKNISNNHKEVCLSISGTQSVRLEKGIIEFENASKKIQVPFKFYSYFECILTSAESYEGSCSKKYKDHIPCSFAYKPVYVDDKFSKQIVLYRGENSAYKFIKEILDEHEYSKKVMKKIFTKV